MKKIVLMVLVVFTIFTISGCGNAGSNNEEHNEYTPPPDSWFPPTINSQTPFDGEINVETTIVISVTFSQEMDATTINSETIKLEKLNNFNFDDRTPVTGTVAYLANIATFTPDIPLEYYTGYMVMITKDATDINGTHLGTSGAFPDGRDNWWYFCTKAGP